MDRIEHAEDPAGSRRLSGVSSSLNPSQEAFPSLPEPEESTSPPPSRAVRHTRQRSRQPSIRLRRLSSLSSIDQQTAIQNEQADAPALQSSSTAEDALSATQHADDDSWLANRRRSNSEPRRGRYSAPPVVQAPPYARTRSSQHMSPVTEETGRPSIDFNTAEQLAPQSGPSLVVPEDRSAQQERPPSRTRMLRRASNAALSAFSRNRASTVSGQDPARQSLARDEYDSRIVDLLDVIGKFEFEFIQYSGCHSFHD